MSIDPYGQFSSPYVGMGNIPHMGLDPDGGALNPFNWGGAAIGAVVGVGLSFAVGEEDKWYLYALGGAAAGGFFTSDYAKVKIWGTHYTTGTHRHSQSYTDIYKRHPYQLKYNGPLFTGANIPEPRILTSRELRFEDRPLPSLTNRFPTPRIHGFRSQHVRAEIRSFGYSDQALESGVGADGVAADLHEIYSNQKRLGFRTVTITFRSTRPTLAVRNYARRIIRRLIALGVPKKDIVQEVAPARTYGEGNDGDQLRSGVSGTWIHDK